MRHDGKKNGIKKVRAYPRLVGMYVLTAVQHGRPAQTFHSLTAAAVAVAMSAGQETLDVADDMIED